MPKQPDLSGLIAPARLRSLPGWLLWRYEQISGSDKPLKVPYYALGGRRRGKQGSPSDRQALVDFEKAKARAIERGFDGVGLALMPEWGITALDFDRVFDANGKLPPEVEAIVSRTYAEKSPSGNGVRAFVEGNLGDRKSRATAERYGMETFAQSGFVTVTGDALFTTEVFGLSDTIAPIDEQLRALCSTRFAPSERVSTEDDWMAGHEPVLGLTMADIESYLSRLDPSMGREDWIKVGMAIHHETEGEGFDLWDAWSAEGQQYPGSDSLERQWDSFTRRAKTGRQVTMATVIKMAKASSDLGLQEIVETARAANIVERLAATTPDFAGRFPIIHGGVFSERKPPTWIIKGVLPNADLGVLFGASGAGKSFVAMDMGLAIARGVEWRGRRVKQGSVLLLAAEGGGGVASRLRAYGTHHGIDLRDVPFGVMHAVPNFLLEEDIRAVVEAITNAGNFDVIIIDTFAQVTAGGNENSGEDMGLAIKHARTIRDATGAMPILVHHSGKDASKGARGHSSLRAATDVEFEVIRPEEGNVRLLRVSKQKDGQDDLSWGFTLDPVWLGTDEDGDEISSLIVAEAEPPKASSPDSKDKSWGKWEHTILEGAALLYPDRVEIPVEEFIRDVAGTVSPPNPGERDNRVQNVRRALMGMTKGQNAPFGVSHGNIEIY